MHLSASFCIFPCLFSLTAGIVRFGHQSATLAAYHHRELHSLAHEVVRERFITLPSRRPLKSVGELIEFELFDEMVLLGDVKEVMLRNDQSSSWTGQLRLSTGNDAEDLLRDEGYFGVSCSKQACAAHLYLYSPQAEYKISPAGTPLSESGEGLYTISEVTLSKEKRTATNLSLHHVSERRNAQEFEKAVKNNLSDKSRIEAQDIETNAATTVDTDLILDIVVLYTREALAKVGGR